MRLLDEKRNLKLRVFSTAVVHFHTSLLPTLRLGSTPLVMSTGATVDVVHQISALLDCKIDRRTCQILMALIDQGVNPVALASSVKELRAQAQALGLSAAAGADAPTTTGARQS